MRVTIDRLAAGGDGVGRLPDGRVVFVPRVAPGDEVDVRVVQTKPRFARGFVERLVVPGPDRTDPACPHYEPDACGGCQLQHLRVPAQHRAKRGFVGDAMRRIGRIDVPDPDLTESPSPWRYRRKITLKGSATGKGTVGLHRFDRPGARFQPRDCLITSEPVMALGRLALRNRRALPERVHSLVIRQDGVGRFHLIVSEPDDTGWQGEDLAAAIGDPTVAIWWRPAGETERLIAGEAGGMPAGAFEQSNAGLAAQIREAAVGEIGTVADRVVWDLYGGVGDTAALLARAGARVWSVESDSAAGEWARARSGAGPSGEVSFVTDRVERVVADLPEPVAVIANPPRAGLAAVVAEWLDAWAARTSGATFVYISCDPATLARDARRMPRMRLRRLHAYDLFPQTSHVETLAVFGSP